MPIPPEDRPAEIVRLAEALARELLSDEYAVLARRAAARLAEAVPDRLAQGRPRSWACGLLYALGRINFLSDPASGDVHMTLKELCAACGVSEATGASKGREVLDLLDSGPLDPRWTLPSRLDRNPVAWMLSVGGMVLDARTLSAESQDLLAQADLIPYGPTVTEPGTLPPGTRVLLEETDGPERFRVVLDTPPPRTMASSGAQRAAERGEIATLRVEIAGTEPPVWRRLDVPLALPLDALHLVFQSAFAWENYHLYAFETKTATYTNFEPGPDDFPTDGACLADLIQRKGSRFVYLYDFGDGWVHDVKVEAMAPPEPGAVYPRCVDGERAGPPEDCGGPWGYAELCAVLADPSHPEHREMKAWAGKRFNPAHFDAAAVNRKLRQAFR